MSTITVKKVEYTHYNADREICEKLVVKGVLDKISYVNCTRNQIKYVLKTDCREYKLFKRAIENETTLRNYTNDIRRFVLWTHSPNCISGTINGYQELAVISKEKVMPILEDYLLHLSDILKAQSVRTMMTSLETFMDLFDVNYSKKRLHKLYPKRTKTGKQKAYTKSQIQKMLNCCKTNKRATALILFLASTGVRIGALSELKWGHLIPFEESFAVHVYAEADEYNVDYWTFCTPEARIAIEQYLLERGGTISDETVIFATMYNHNKPMSSGTIRSSINANLHKAQIVTDGISMIHGFRKFFKTSLVEAKYIIDGKKIPAISEAEQEKMMGHSNGVRGTYHDASPEALYTEYSKAIDSLTISIEESQKTEIATLVSDKKDIFKKQQQDRAWMESQIEQLRQEQSIRDKLFSSTISPKKKIE